MSKVIVKVNAKTLIIDTVELTWEEAYAITSEDEERVVHDILNGIIIKVKTEG